MLSVNKDLQGRLDYVRGIWAWSSSLSEYGTEKAIKDLKEMGFTDLFLLVKGTMGKVYWPSRIALSTLKDNTVLPKALEVCRKLNLRLHAWFIVSQDKTYLQLNPGAGMWGIPLEEQSYEYRLGEHTCFRISSAVVDFASDENYKDYLFSLIKEIVTDYEPDGIHLDYIRYPNGAWGWGPFQMRRLHNLGVKIELLLKKAIQTWGKNGDNQSILNALECGDSGVTKWANLRAKDVTDLTQAITQLVRNVRPSTVLSAALIPEGGDPNPSERNFALVHCGQRYQDFVELCDLVLPMAYHQDFNKSVSWVEDITRTTCKIATGKSKVVIGIQAHNAIRAAEVVEAVKIARKSGADGVCIFAFHEIFKNKEMKLFLSKCIN